MQIPPAIEYWYIQIIETFSNWAISIISVIFLLSAASDLLVLLKITTVAKLPMKDVVFEQYTRPKLNAKHLSQVSLYMYMLHLA